MLPAISDIKPLKCYTGNIYGANCFNIPKYSVQMVKSHRLRWAGHVARAPLTRYVRQVLDGRPTSRGLRGDRGYDGRTVCPRTPSFWEFLIGGRVAKIGPLGVRPAMRR